MRFGHRLHTDLGPRSRGAIELKNRALHRASRKHHEVRHDLLARCAHGEPLFPLSARPRVRSGQAEGAAARFAADVPQFESTSGICRDRSQASFGRVSSAKSVVLGIDNFAARERLAIAVQHASRNDGTHLGTRIRPGRGVVEARHQRPRQFGAFDSAVVSQSTNRDLAGEIRTFREAQRREDETAGQLTLRGTDRVLWNEVVRDEGRIGLTDHAIEDEGRLEPERTGTTERLGADDRG